jgi:mannosyltransferase OCH1-like enzyme
MKIPKVIHQTWYTSKPHAHLASKLEANKKQNPGWEYKLWSDHDIIVWLRKNKLWKELDMFRSLYVGPAKADLFRMLLLYHEGGFYMDVDNFLTRPIDEFLNPAAECMIAMNFRKEIDFCICAAVPGNIYIENTLTSITRKLKARVDGTAYHVTGPPNWNNTNYNNKENHPDREYRIQIIGPYIMRNKGWGDYPRAFEKTPSTDHWLQPIEFNFLKNPIHLSKLPNKVPTDRHNWKSARDDKRSLYNK